jgi:hypothetical protein
MLFLLLLLLTICVVNAVWRRNRARSRTNFNRGPQSIAKAWELKKGLSEASHSSPSESDSRGPSQDRQRFR